MRSVYRDWIGRDQHDDICADPDDDVRSTKASQDRELQEVMTLCRRPGGTTITTEINVVTTLQKR